MDQELILNKASRSGMENVGRLSTRAGHRGRGAKEVMSTILGISLSADLCLLFKLPQIAAVRIRKGRDRPTPPLIIGYLVALVSSLAAWSPPYFFRQVQFSDGLLQPTHTPFLISLPQVLHGLHPQVWHIVTSLIPGSSKWKHITSPSNGR